MAARAPRPLTAGDEIVRVPVGEEEPVVERRPVVNEGVVRREPTVQDEQVVEVDPRRGLIAVERRGAAR